MNNIGERKFEKSILSLKDIPANEPLRIIKCVRKVTTFGVKTILELEKHVVFLSEKYSFIPDDVIEQLSSGNYNLNKSFEWILLQIRI